MAIAQGVARPELDEIPPGVLGRRLALTGPRRGLLRLIRERRVGRAVELALDCVAGDERQGGEHDQQDVSRAHRCSLLCGCRQGSRPQLTVCGSVATSAANPTLGRAQGSSRPGMLLEALDPDVAENRRRRSCSASTPGNGYFQ